MKKIISNIKKLLFVQYRLTHYEEGHPNNHYMISRRMARWSVRIHDEAGVMWSLYKTGPLGIKEREVDSSQHKRLHRDFRSIFASEKRKS